MKQFGFFLIIKETNVHTKKWARQSKKMVVCILLNMSVPRAGKKMLKS